MRALKALSKLMFLGMLLVSLVAVAESYYDRSFYTADFLNNVEEVSLDLPNQPEKRIVASERKKKLPLIQEVPMTLKSIIDGKWQITRVVNEEGIDAYNVKNERSFIAAEFELIEKSLIRVDSDIEQTFFVSLYTRAGTIVLFKEFGDGYEIVEAKKILSEKKEDSVAEVEQIEEKKSKYDIEEDLFLVSALDPKKNRNVLRGESVSGYAYLKNGELIMENIQLHVGTGSQTVSLSTEARIQEHGTFNDGRGTQGIVTNVNKDEIKVRFSTGALAGAMLNFVTYQKKSEIESKFGASTQANFPQTEAVEQAQPINAQVEQPEVYEQEVQREEYDPYADEQYEKTESPQEQNQVVEQRGEEEEYYEEVDGQRENESELPEFNDYAEDFQEMRNEADGQDREPSSVTGYSF